MSPLPKGWTRRTIGSLCTLVNGRAFKPTDWSAEGLPIVRIQNLNDPAAPFNRYDGAVRPRFLIDTGVLLFAWSGTPGTSFGAHVWTGGPAILNQHIFNVIFDADLVDKHFFRLAINQKLDELIDKAHGGVGLRHVTKGKVEATEIDLPPLSEQRRIIAKMEGLFARTAAARSESRRIERLVERYRGAILAAAFRGELTAQWRETVTDSAGPSLDHIAALRSAYLERAEIREKPPASASWRPSIELPPEWTWASVDQLAVRVQYGSSTKTTDGPGVPVLRMGNVCDGRLDYRRLKYLPRKHAEFPDLLLDDGDILFNRTNSAELVGKTAVYRDTGGPVSFASYLIRLSVVGYLPELLSAYVNSEYGRQWVSTVVSQQVGQANVNGTKLKGLGVPLMPMDEQRELLSRITRCFARLDRVAAEAKRATDLLERLERATLFKAFRGEFGPQHTTRKASTVLETQVSVPELRSRPMRGRARSRGDAA